MHKEISSVPVQQILSEEACRKQDQVKAVFYVADLHVLSYDGHGEALVKKPGVSSFIGGCLAPFHLCGSRGPSRICLLSRNLGGIFKWQSG